MPSTQTSLFRHQFPLRCPGRFLVLRDDLYGAGLGWTGKLMVFVLIIAKREGRILVEEEASRRWCTRSPGTLQCYYLPWTNCSVGDAADVKRMSLRRFSRGGSYYGMSRSTHDDQPAAFRLLFRPRPHILLQVDALIAQCGGADLWTVHVRDSPEKIKERGNLPTLPQYLSKIPPDAKRILWQTSNPRVFRELMGFSRSSSFAYCHTNYSRRLHDVWGGRNTSMTDESGLTGAVNAEAARRGIGCISLRSSMWTWFITVGTNQTVVLV